MKWAAVLLIVSFGAMVANAGIIATVENGLYAIPNYQTSYSVADGITGDKKSQTETRVGDVVKGSYSVLQPDGVLRIVHYTSHPITGFQAQVINKGAAIHPSKVLNIGGLKG